MEEQIENTVLYTTQFCPYCVRAKSLLNSKNVEFTEIDIDLRPDKFTEMLDKSGGVTSVPQIFIGEFHVGGCDDLFALEAKGELDKYLVS